MPVLALNLKTACPLFWCKLDFSSLKNEDFSPKKYIFGGGYGGGGAKLVHYSWYILRICLQKNADFTLLLSQTRIPWEIIIQTLLVPWFFGPLKIENKWPVCNVFNPSLTRSWYIFHCQEKNRIVQPINRNHITKITCVQHKREFLLHFFFFAHIRTRFTKGT